MAKDRFIYSLYDPIDEELIVVIALDAKEARKKAGKITYKNPGWFMLSRFKKVTITSGGTETILNKSLKWRS